MTSQEIQVAEDPRVLRARLADTKNTIEPLRKYERRLLKRKIERLHVAKMNAQVVADENAALKGMDTQDIHLEQERDAEHVQEDAA